MIGHYVFFCLIYVNVIGFTFLFMDLSSKLVKLLLLKAQQITNLFHDFLYTVFVGFLPFEATVLHHCHSVGGAAVAAQPAPRRQD